LQFVENAQPCSNWHLSIQTNVTSSLYTVVHSGYSLISSTFPYSLRWFLHKTAHNYHPCYAMDDICEYRSWCRRRI